MDNISINRSESITQIIPYNIFLESAPDYQLNIGDSVEGIPDLSGLEKVVNHFGKKLLSSSNSVTFDGDTTATALENHFMKSDFIYSEASDSDKKLNYSLADLKNFNATVIAKEHLLEILNLFPVNQPNIQNTTSQMYLYFQTQNPYDDNTKPLLFFIILDLGSNNTVVGQMYVSDVESSAKMQTQIDKYMDDVRAALDAGKGGR